MRHKVFSYAILLILGLGLWQFGNGIWIHAKAQLAQILISQAWQKTLQEQVSVKPWSWADTWPVARLRWQDEVDLFVLAGVNGASLPFGPGMDEQSPEGNILLAGHQDTHFAFLADIQMDDRLTLIDQQGRERIFRVQSREVIDSRVATLQPDRSRDKNNPVLTLVTCYPFNALRPGGPLRLVVRAVPESSAAGTEQRSRV